VGSELLLGEVADLLAKELVLFGEADAARYFEQRR
jgi:hypothetical protein